MNGTPLKDLILWPGVEKLTLISGGRSIPESTELLDFIFNRQKAPSKDYYYYPSY